MNILARLCAAALFLCGGMFVVSCSNNNPSASNPGPVSSPVKPNYAGTVDRVSCEAIGGWVWNSANPNDDIKVDIYADDKPIATVQAKLPRPDLNNIGTRNYGFVLETPPDLKDGKLHAITAKVAGSNYVIPIWEKIQPTFTCKPK